MESKTRESSARPSQLNPLSGPGEGIEGMKKYQLFLIMLDICCNIMVDSGTRDAAFILVGFGLQTISLIINFVMYIMGTANLAMRSGLRSGTIRHHEANVASIATYFILTIWWYTFAIKMTWTSAKDHFSFTFVDDSEAHPLGLSVVRQGIANVTTNSTNANSTVDFHPVWGSSFIGLYTVHRIVAVIYYIIYTKTMFILLNGPLLGKLGYYKDQFPVGIESMTEPERRMAIETVSSFVTGREYEENFGQNTSGSKGWGDVRREMIKSKNNTPYRLDSKLSSPIKVFDPNARLKSQARRPRKSSEEFSSEDLA